jgi:hypothetical protein
MTVGGDRGKQRVYQFGEGHPIQSDGKPLYSWPYAVYFSPECPSGEFYLSEGDGRNGNGSYFSAADLLKPQWRSHLEITGTLWLLPLLERRLAGEVVTPKEYLDAYRSKHGSVPPESEWPL